MQLPASLQIFNDGDRHVAARTKDASWPVPHELCTKPVHFLMESVNVSLFKDAAAESSEFPAAREGSQRPSNLLELA